MRLAYAKLRKDVVLRISLDNNRPRGSIYTDTHVIGVAVDRNGADSHLRQFRVLRPLVEVKRIRSGVKYDADFARHLFAVRSCARQGALEPRRLRECCDWKE